MLRLRYFYLALATIGLGIIFSALIVEARGVTGGTLGLAPVPPLDLFGFKIDTYLRQYYVVWIVALLILLFTERALGMRVGRALRAVATSEIAAQTLGVRTANWKLVAFVASAVFCAIAGALYAFTLAAITPGAFAFGAAILPIIMMLIGGGGSIWGGLVGAVLMTWLSNSLSGTQQWSGVIYAAIMILLLLFLPMGITGLFTKRRLVSVKTAFRRQSRAETLECATVAEADGSTEACGTQVALPVYVPEHASPALDDGEPGALFADLRRQESGTKGDELLKIQDVSVDFGGLRAVNEVSLDVRTGQIVALIGPNGAGKTTLFNVVSRLQRASGGQVWLGGEDITDLSPAASARLGMARTFQNLRIFENMDVLENVLVGLSPAREGGSDRRGSRPAEAAPRGEGLAGRAPWMRCDSSASTRAPISPRRVCPYGQQRLVEIARALASEPRLLLLDEPAAGMNAAEREYLVDRIRRIRDAGVTVLLVEHDIELVMGLCDWVTVLDYGKLIAVRRAGRREEGPGRHRGVPRRGPRGRRRRVRRPQHVAGRRRRVGRYRRCGERCSKSAASRPATAPSTRCATCRWTCPRARSSRSSAPTAPARPRCFTPSPGVLRPSSGLDHLRGSGHHQARPLEDRRPRRLPGAGGTAALPVALGGGQPLCWALRGAARATSVPDDLAYVYDLFPALAERRAQPAGTLSGGEQQMVAIGRALMGKPDLLLLDEPSMGLAPLAVERIFEALKIAERPRPHHVDGGAERGDGVFGG